MCSLVKCISHHVVKTYWSRLVVNLIVLKVRRTQKYPWKIMNSFYLINFQVQCTTWIYDCSLYIETVCLIVMYM